MDSAAQLGLGGVPLLGILEGDVGGSVVHHSKGAHPKVVAQPGHHPELEEAQEPGVVDDGWECNAHEGIHRRQTDLHLYTWCMVRHRLCRPLESAVKVRLPFKAYDRSANGISDDYAAYRLTKLQQVAAAAIDV